jgi:hypothetical protein
VFPHPVPPLKKGNKEGFEIPLNLPPLRKGKVLTKIILAIHTKGVGTERGVSPSHKIFPLSKHNYLRACIILLFGEGVKGVRLKYSEAILPFRGPHGIVIIESFGWHS